VELYIFQSNNVSVLDNFASIPNREALFV